MQHYPAGRSLQSRIILFVAIVGLAMIVVALTLGTGLLSSSSDDGRYSAAELRATAVALNVRATEISVAATRMATGSSLPSAVADPLDVSALFPTDNDVGSRSRPVPVGESFTTADGLQIAVLGTIYDAWPLVSAENSFNSPPAEDMRMVMVETQVSDLDGSEQTPRSVSGSHFRIVGSRGVVYAPFDSQTRCGVVPNALDYEIFVGATVSGNVCVVAPQDETDFLLIYRSSSRWGDAVIYFDLPAPAVTAGETQTQQK